MERVIDLINKNRGTAFSFEILPPLKGNSIQSVYRVIDKLRDFDPKYINITSHHSEAIEVRGTDGMVRTVNLRKRPGSVAIASAIQHRYGIAAVWPDRPEFPGREQPPPPPRRRQAAPRAR